MHPYRGPFGEVLPYRTPRMRIPAANAPHMHPVGIHSVSPPFFLLAPPPPWKPEAIFGGRGVILNLRVSATAEKTDSLQ